MDQLDRILQSMAEKINGHPALKQAYAQPCSSKTEAEQIAALYRRLETLCQQAQSKRN